MSNKPAPAWIIVGVAGLLMAGISLLNRESLSESLALKLSLVIGLVLLLMVFIRIAAGPK